jgi:hypothetical protein
MLLRSESGAGLKILPELHGANTRAAEGSWIRSAAAPAGEDTTWEAGVQFRSLTNEQKAKPIVIQPLPSLDPRSNPYWRQNSAALWPVLAEVGKPSADD